MLKAPEIAKILIEKSYIKERKITNLKLQKLLYFAQGHFMQENNGTPLFNEDFQAWAHGPVISGVYQEYKQYMWFNLPRASSITTVREEINNFLDRLLDYYGAQDGKELEITSHDERPWIDARGSLSLYSPSTKIISKESISEYYLNEKECLVRGSNASE